MTGRQLEPADFEGAQLDQMRSWVQGGAGSEALYEQSGYWNAEDQYMRDLKTRLEEKLKQVGAVMQSESGEAMKDQAMPVVLWTEITADSAKLQSEQMTAQGEAFKKVQTSIPDKSEEQAVPDDGWLEEGWDNLTTGSTDAEDAKAHNEKLRQEAVQAFTAYQDTTQGNVSGSAEFQEPPKVAVGSAGVESSSVPGTGGVQQPASTSSSSAGSAGTASGAGLVAGSGAGAGGYAGSGSAPAGTGSAWANAPGSGGNAGNGGGNAAGAGARPGTPGYAGGTAGRPGMPGAGRPGAGAGSGGARGAGSGAGRGVGAGGGAGRAGGPGMGAGGRAGAGGLGGASGSTAAGGAAGGAGGRGGAGMGGAGARGSGQQGEEDAEHETPDYLVGDQGVFDEDLPRVAPPVFGE